MPSQGGLKKPATHDAMWQAGHQQTTSVLTLLNASRNVLARPAGSAVVTHESASAGRLAYDLAMCGRYTVRRIQALANAVSASLGKSFEQFSAHGPRYNVAPSQQVPVVRLDKAGRRVLGTLR